MEWTPEVTGGFVTIFGGLIAAFTLIIKNMGKRADPAVLSIITMMQENESKRDEVQAELARSQAESLKSLSASQESQAKSLEYIGQLHQGATTALTAIIEQLNPVAPMVASINNIESQNNQLSGSVKTLGDTIQETLNEILFKIDALQQSFDDVKTRQKETERDVKDAEKAVAEIRSQVVEIQKVATQEQLTPVVVSPVTSPEEKPDDNTDNQTA